MDHNQFFADIKANKINPVYFFSGEEAYVMHTAIKRLRGAILTPGLEELNETRLEAPRASAIIAACETLPVMAERRLVTIYDCPLLTSGKSRDEAQEAEVLSNYLDNPPDTACLIFVCPHPDTRKKVPQKLSKMGASVTFALLSEGDLVKWITTRLKSSGKNMAHTAISALVARVGRSLSTIEAELLKLIDYKSARSEITSADIEQVCSVSAEFSVFEMTDAITQGHSEKALSILKTLIDGGESRLGVLALITRQFRLMTHVSAIRAENRKDGAKLLGLSPYVYGKIEAQARRFDKDWLRRAYDRCVEADYSIKSGAMRDEAALDRLIIFLTQNV